MDITDSELFPDKVVGGLSFIRISRLPHQSSPKNWTSVNAQALSNTSDFIYNVLARGHSDLGRSGPVCPFIRASVRMNAIYLTVSQVGPTERGQLVSDLCATEMVFDQLVKEMRSNTDRMFSAAILALPRLASDEGIDLLNSIQHEAKLRFVQQGRMIGQFYPGCTERGLHSSTFRPLDAPLPFLAIRNMTLQDAPFMLGDNRYKQSYLARFGEDGARQLRLAQTASDQKSATIR